MAVLMAARASVPMAVLMPGLMLVLTPAPMLVPVVPMAVPIAALVKMRMAALKPL